MYCFLRYYTRYWKICVALFIIALLIRILFCAILDPKPFSLNMKKLDIAAQKLKIDKFQPPLYPLFVRAIYSVFGLKNYRALYIVQGIVSALVVPLLFLIVTHISTTAAAYTAGIIAALYPNFILHNLAVLEQSIGILLVTVLMLILVIDCRESHRAIAAAITSGLGIMLMPVLLYFVPGLVLILKRRRIFIGVLALTLLPIFIYNVKWHRKFVPIFHRYTWAIDLRRYQDAASKSIEKLYNNGAQLFRNPSKIVYEEGIDKSVMIKNYIGYYSYIILLITGLIGVIRFCRKAHRNIVIPHLTFVLLLIFIGRFDIEFRVLLEPLLIVYLSILVTNRFASAFPADQYSRVHDERRFDKNT